jgi:hypothetical protein
MQRDQDDRERDYDTENEPNENFDRGETETELTDSPTRSKPAGRAEGERRTPGKRAGSKPGTARAGGKGKRPQRPSRTPR